MNDVRLKFLLVFSLMLSAILLNTVGVVILQSINQYNVSHATASILEGCKDITIAISSLFIANVIAPILGYKRSMLLGLFILTLICFLMPILDSFLMAKILLAGAGICYTLFKVSVYSIATICSKDDKSHSSLISIIEGFFMVGVLVGYWLFYAFMNFSDSPKAWLNTYNLIAIISALTFVVALMTKFPEDSKRKPEGNIVSSFCKSLNLFKNYIVLTFIITAFFYVFVEQAINTWLPTLYFEFGSVSESESVLIASIFGGSIALGRVFWGVLMRNIHWYKIVIPLLVSLLCLVLGLKTWLSLQPLHAMPKIFGIPLALISLPLLGFILGPIYPAMCASILRNCKYNEYSHITGIIILTSAIGGTVGSTMTGFIFDQMPGIQAIQYISIPVISLLISVMLYRYHKNRMVYIPNVIQNTGQRNSN